MNLGAQTAALQLLFVRRLRALRSCQAALCSSVKGAAQLPLTFGVLAG